MVEDRTVPLKLLLNPSSSRLSWEKSHPGSSALLCALLLLLQVTNMYHFYAVLSFNCLETGFYVSHTTPCIVLPNSHSTHRRPTNLHTYTCSKILVNSTKIKLNILLRSPWGPLFENDYCNIIAVRCHSLSE